MRLDAFLLADSIATPPDGKVYMQGGGITKISPPELPFAVPQLGILVRLRIDDDEAIAKHVFEFSWTDPEGDLLIPKQTVESEAVGPLPLLAEGEDRYLSLAFNMHGVTFRLAGAHRLELNIDNGLITQSLALAVVAPPEAGAPMNRAERRRQACGGH
jgi:hypothetical protein